ncbi:MAG TPA: DNA methyltransferase, partial [Ktedonobacterales bacterium]|nr:DNA methyltransferase [Ktedonobacterales bacterium]
MADQLTFPEDMPTDFGLEVAIPSTPDNGRPVRQPHHSVATEPKRRRSSGAPKKASGSAAQLSFSEARNAPERIGKKIAVNDAQFTPQAPVQMYVHPHGGIWLGDAAAWLRSLETASVDLIFAAPPYNLKKAEWDTFASQQAYVEWSLSWIEQAARVLKPTGTLYIC